MFAMCVGPCPTSRALWCPVYYKNHLADLIKTYITY